jgi:hypothetical protein
VTTQISLSRRLHKPDGTPWLGRNWIRKLNFLLAVGWAVMIPVAIMTGWLYSIAFISTVSIYANFISHVAAWRADVPNARAPQE